jgi:hypothetical protein
MEVSNHDEISDATVAHTHECMQKLKCNSAIQNTLRNKSTEIRSIGQNEISQQLQNRVRLHILNNLVPTD